MSTKWFTHLYRLVETQYMSSRTKQYLLILEHKHLFCRVCSGTEHSRTEHGIKQLNRTVRNIIEQGISNFLPHSSAYLSSIIPFGIILSIYHPPYCRRSLLPNGVPSFLFHLLWTAFDGLGAGNLQVPQSNPRPVRSKSRISHRNPHLSKFTMPI